MRIKVLLGLWVNLLITIGKELLLQMKIVALLTIWHISLVGRNIFQRQGTIKYIEKNHV